MSDNKIVQTFVEYLPLSGVRMHIQPLNAAIIKAIAVKGEAELPYPDPTPYQHELPPPDVPGALSDPLDDPAYKALVVAVDRQRNTRLNNALIDYAVTFPDFANRDDLMRYFAPQREELRKIADLPDDNWEVTRDHIILSGSQDYANIIHIAAQSVELTGGEIADGIRVFRPNLPGQPVGNVARAS